MEEAKRDTLHTKIKETSESLANIFQETMDSVERLTGKSGNVAALSKAGAETSEKVEKKSINGKAELDVQQTQMNQIEQSMNRIEEEMSKLEVIANEIGDIVKIVSKIAEQTNLLSLNASIESARAGEHGKGFAVVASEVRKLSEETKKSVSTVSNLIGNTNTQISIVSSHVSEVNEMVTESGKKMTSVNLLFDEIVENMKMSKIEDSQINQEVFSFINDLEDVKGAISHVSASIDSLMDLTNR